LARGELCLEEEEARASGFLACGVRALFTVYFARAEKSNILRNQVRTSLRKNAIMFSIINPSFPRSLSLLTNPYPNSY
jgi:hypothetical protein